MPRTQLERIWIGVGCLAAFLMILVGYLFFISPQSSQTDTVNGQVSSAKALNASLQQRIDSLAQQNTNLAKYQAAYTQAQLALPSTSGLPDFLRTLQSIGNATSANVSSLSVGTPSDVTSIGGTAPTSTASGSTSAATGGLRIYALSISAQVTGTIQELGQFLTQLQSVQPRAVLISSITQTSGAGGSAGSTGLSLTMQAFVAPTGAVESAALSAASHR